MPRISWLLVTLIVLVSISLRAESLADYPEDRDHRVRTIDARLQSIIDEGVRFSLTFEALVDRLDRSDLVVYVERETRPIEGIEGCLTFISSQAGTRYLRVRVAYISDRARQLAIVAHELRHAVEVADTPRIVDSRSFEREYERFGYENPYTGVRGRAFDTDAAVAAGVRVLREIRTGN